MLHFYQAFLILGTFNHFRFEIVTTGGIIEDANVLVVRLIRYC